MSNPVTLLVASSDEHFREMVRDNLLNVPNAKVVSEYQGPAVIAAYTVLYEGDTPARAVMICDLPDGRRTLAATTDAPLAAAMTEREFCGRAVRVGQDRRVTVPDGR